LTRCRHRRCGELAGHEGHVLADHDLGFLVVERHQVRRRQDVGVGLRLRKRGEGRPAVAPPKLRITAPMLSPVTQPRASMPVVAWSNPDVARRRAEVGAAPPMFLLPLVADCLPLDAEVGGLVRVDLDDQAST
jgi:hypothetical protein